MLQNEVMLSGFLSNYAEHVVWRRTVYCDSVCLRLRPMARTQLRFPISSRHSRHRPNGLLSQNFSHGVWTTHSGVSHGRAPKWLKLRPEWPIAGSGVLGRSAVSFPVGSGAEPQKILIFCISGTAWAPQNVYISILRYLKEQKFLGRLGGPRPPRLPL